MNISQGGHRRFDSFNAMFQALRVPIANRDFIHRAFFGVEYSEIIETSAYVKVVRTDSPRDLRIYRGIIGGYESEAEAVALSDAKDAYPSDSRPGTWFVYLPDHGEPRDGHSAPRQTVSQQVACPNCFILMDSSGACGNCD